MRTTKDAERKQWSQILFCRIISEDRLKIESEWRNYSKGNGKARRDYLEVHLRIKSVVMVPPIFDTNVQRVVFYVYIFHLCFLKNSNISPSLQKVNCIFLFFSKSYLCLTYSYTVSPFWDSAVRFFHIWKLMFYSSIEEYAS